MTRNTTRRVEVAVPVTAPDLREHLEQMFRDQLRDTAKGRIQQPDGAYVHAQAQNQPFNAQEHFCDQAYSGAWALSKPEPPKPAPKPKTVKASPAKPAPAPKKAAPVRKPKRGLLGRLIGRD